jgi:cation diffusion facilitator CzcD-associated flavoprotein CzcO
MSTSPVRVAVIGAGISGITAAHVLKKNGFEGVVYEKADRPGGVWAVAYPQITLQNLRQHYHLLYPFKKPGEISEVCVEQENALDSNFGNFLPQNIEMILYPLPP